MERQSSGAPTYLRRVLHCFPSLSASLSPSSLYCSCVNRFIRAAKVGGETKSGFTITVIQSQYSACYDTEEVRCQGELLNMGKTLAFTKVDLFSNASGKLLATGPYKQAHAVDIFKNEKRKMH